MQQYYTSIEIDNGRYIGVVYNSSNNVIEYRSKSCSSQMQAMMDITEYLKTKQPSNQTGPEVKQQQQIITNSTTYHPTPQVPRKCCGR